jgi:hypothetical protein
MAKSTKAGYLFNPYAELIKAMHRRIKLEKQDFKNINLDKYYHLCDRETMFRRLVLDDMIDKKIPEFENKSAKIFNNDGKLTVKLK